MIKRFLGLAAFLLCVGIGHVSAPLTQAQSYTPISPSKLAKEIDDFATPGEDGSQPVSAFLVWQYSGDRGTGQEFGNDKYSFFRNIDPGPAICRVMQEKAGQYPSVKLGVNMWDATDAKHSEGKVADHFRWLKEKCGTQIVRVFAKSSYPDGSGVTKVINAAESAGIQVIIAIGDYSNGGGGMPQAAPQGWYAGGYTTGYLPFAKTVNSLAAGRDGVYGLELANEAHCGNDPGILPAYTSWVNAVAAQLTAGKIGIGQMGNAGGACDNPDDGSFTKSNEPAGISMASAHYYKKEDKEMALRARKATPAGKEFYIGEMGWGADEELEPEDYYLYNIKGLATGDASLLLNDMIDQGYQTHCTTPKIKVEAVQGGEIARFMDIVNNDPAKAAYFRDTKSIQTFNYANARVPLLRDENPSAALFNSLEDFFGFQSLTKDPADIQKSIESAPMFTMMDLEDQCRHKIKMLETIDYLCGQLDDPATCALYQPIPEMPQYNTRDLLSLYRSQGDALSCSNVYGSGSALRSNLTPEQEEIMHALQNTPLYLEKSFRLAFLVIVTDLLPDEPTSFFNFLRQDGTSDPSQSVKVLAFKIPDFGTNRSINEATYIDPLQRTRNLLLGPDEIEKIQQDVEAEKDKLRTTGASELIKCGTEDCRDPLVRSVVELVNRSGIPACDAEVNDLEYEPVNQIYSRGKLTSSEGTQFSDGGDPAGDIFNTGANTSETEAATETTEEEAPNSPQLAVFNFLSNIHLGLRGGKSETTIRSYLVMPVGAELSTAELALMNFFDPNWVDNYAKNPDEEKYYRLADVDQRMQGGKVENKFFDGSDPAYIQANCSAPGAIFPDCALKKATLEVEADQNDHAPRIPFGGIGYIARKIQETLNQVATAPYEFISSVGTTEEWLLQNGASGSQGSGSGTENDPTGGYLSQEVIDTSDCRSFMRIGAGPGTITDPSRLGRACTSADGPAANVGKPAIVYNSSLDIPNWRNGNDATPACNEALYKYVVCTNGPGLTKDGLVRQGGAPALIAHKVDSTGRFDQSGSMTACEFVVQTAQSKGVSPRLALAMWGEESGFSAFTRADSAQDFGYMAAGSSSRASGSIKQQVEGFANLILNPFSQQPGRNPATASYLDFLLTYSGEKKKETTPPVLFCNNREFPDRIKTFYNYLGNLL